MNESLKFQIISFIIVPVILVVLLSLPVWLAGHAEARLNSSDRGDDCRPYVCDTSDQYEWNDPK